MRLFKYKGYIGYATSNLYGQWFGLVQNLKIDTIKFQAESEDECEKEFIASIEDYITFCKELKVTPEPPQELIE